MRVIRLITIFLATIAVAAVVTALMIGSEWQIEASREINTPADRIFPIVNTLSKWPDWTVWNEKKHPNVHFSYDGPENGIGAAQIWHEGNSTGLLQITDSQTNHSIEYRFNMSEGLFMVNGRITLTETQTEAVTTRANTPATTPATTKVTWTLWGNNGSNLIARLITLVFKPMLKSDIQQSLTNLEQQFAGTNISNSK